ncbi:hypothetical protein D7V21_05735 [Acinetobacter guerrae]|uniref:Lipoprotein n=1 Tax=Acinetobacter guerrae TaxID=1843371 RepID=A0A3A8EIU7_9GAMM|nr:hypothetical protein [Acinetobacter guerrae]RKG34852.1 hypothetical protein D7V21_05735 [Acinetobacter guerrae]
MKYSILTMMLFGSLFLTGCGGSSDDSGQSNTSGSNSNSSGSQSSGENSNGASVSVTLVDKITGIAVRESLYEGVIASIIDGVDELKENKTCTSGTYQRTGSVVSFSQCKGLFETDDQASVSGSLDLGDGSTYTLTNFVESFPTGETRTLNGSIKETNNNDTSGSFSTSNLSLVSDLNATKTTYNLSDYALNWADQDITNVKITISGHIKQTGSKEGNFDITFTNANDPYFLKTNDDGIAGYPYSGTLTITDTSNSINPITVTKVNSTSAQYKAVINNTTLFDKTIAWSELLAF